MMPVLFVTTAFVLAGAVSANAAAPLHGAASTSVVPAAGPALSAAGSASRLLAQDRRDWAPKLRRSRDGNGPSVRWGGPDRPLVQEPMKDFYVNAVQVYPWSEGALYRLYTAPERVSEIALQPGEALISVAAGDTARWVIGDTTSGSGAERRTHILVKPSAAGLRTNLVITTDRRLYRVEVASSGGAAMAGIGWTYPADELLAVRRAEAAAAAARPVASAIALETLNFGYAIEGDRPPWRPVRAFDDGRRVFIQFPASLAQGEAPPLFVVGQGGRSELVNYRLSGRYYVVDRLFGAAELRLGERRQQVVRITRTDDSRRSRTERP